MSELMKGLCAHHAENVPESLLQFCKHRDSVVQRVSAVGCFVRLCLGPSGGFTFSQS